MKRHALRIKRPGGGFIETLIEDPRQEHAGLALIAHPHPLHGGTMDNKVVHTLAKAALQCGYVAVRSNFRGVGASDGEFDHGIGETEDLHAVAAAIAPHYPGLEWSLLGFSFGAYVQHRLARRMPAKRLLLVGPAVSMYPFEAPAIPTDIIHGAADQLIPLPAVDAYARAHGITLHVVPDADHFFHGRLTDLKQLLLHLCQSSSSPA